MYNSSLHFGNVGRRRFGAIALASVALACTGLPKIALAHASLVSSEPTDGEVLKHSPSRVTAWFEQELEETASTIAVFDAHERQVDDGSGGVDLYDPDHASMTAMVTVALVAGRYAVRWIATSAADGHSGHPSGGEYFFEVR